MNNQTLLCRRAIINPRESVELLYEEAEQEEAVDQSVSEQDVKSDAVTSAEPDDVVLGGAVTEVDQESTKHKDWLVNY